MSSRDNNQRQLKVGKEAGKFRYIMQAEIYNTLDAQKVVHEAAVRSGIAEQESALQSNKQ